MKKLFSLLAFASIMMVACTDPNAGGDDPTPTGGTPKADFEYAIDGLTVTFTDKSENATSYKWDFGDGESAKTASPTHEYLAGGSYTVTLTVANADGERDTKEASITLEGGSGSVKAFFSATAQAYREGNFGRTVAFDASASQGGSSIAWDFGDGEKGSEFKMSHTFAEYGTYTVKATVTGGEESDTYTATVEVVPLTELLKGGSMEEDDAQYWGVRSADASTMDDGYSGTEGLPSFTTTFGYTEDGPKGGKGGCLRLGGENQFHDWADNITVYQGVDLKEGEIIRLSAQLKWGADTNDNGLFWLCIGPKANKEDEHPTATDDNIFVQFFNWWSQGVDTPGTPVPPYDGDLTGSEGYSQGDDWGFSSPVDALGEGMGVCFTAPADGTYYIMFEVRNVWSFTYFGKPYFIDEVSAQIVL